MGSLAIGAGLTDGSVGYKSGVSSKGEIEGKIIQLKRQRDDYKKQENSKTSADLEKKISDIDDRLKNLDERLKKLQKDDGECQTCANRRYQDGSDDPGVSFKTASKVGPEGAEAAVRGHEYEHVYRNQAKAARENREVVYQTVHIKHAICPECGKNYAAGGETITVTRPKPETDHSEQIKQSEQPQFDTDLKIGRDGENDNSQKPGEIGQVNENKADKKSDFEEYRGGYETHYEKRFSAGLSDKTMSMGKLLNVVA